MDWGWGNGAKSAGIIENAVLRCQLISLFDLVEIVFQLFSDLELTPGVVGPRGLLVDLTEQVMRRFIVGVELNGALQHGFCGR